MSRLFKVFAGVQLIGFLTLGLLTAFLLPPFQAPDEPAHWGAAYARSEGWRHFISKGSHKCLHAYALANHFEVGRIAFAAQERFHAETFRTLRHLKRSCDYATIEYGGVLTYPGVIAARLLTTHSNKSAPRALRTYYTARIFQGLCVLGTLIWLAWKAYAARRLQGTFLIFATCMSPLFIQQCFTITADTVVLALAILSAGHLLLWSKMSRFDFFLLALLGAIACYTKPATFVLVPIACLGGALLALLGSGQSWRDFLQTERSRLVGNGVDIAASFIAAALISFKEHPVPPEQVAGQTLSISGQLHFVANNFPVAFGAWNQDLWSRVSPSALSNYLGWLSMRTSAATQGYWLDLLWIALLLEVTVLLRGKSPAVLRTWRSLPWKDIAARFGVMLGLLALLYVAALLIPMTLYLVLTQVGADTVRGMQARYYFPIVLMLPAIVGAGLASNQPSTLAATPAVAGRTSKLVPWALAILLIFIYMQFAISLQQDFITRYW